MSETPRAEDRARSYVFVVTYGRSGSTLLMGILNSIPGYLIRGENGGVTFDLYNFHTTLSKHANRADRQGASERPHAPWFGIDNYRPEEAKRGMRKLVEESLLLPTPDTRVTGFKEIRWNKRDLVPYLRFLKDVFPGAKFVMNVRDLEQVQQSEWWKETDPAALRRFDARIRDAATQMGEDAYLVSYDEYVADPASLEGLFSWLGEPFDLDGVRKVLAIRHSY
ncbi:sulfotransferase [Nocardioides insulae]|uniref:sulfotransferase n=1 Tax=Nocardioides insulae TaxID=394734 RepID=UPI00040861FD|nr:sulfotransferase [Nocardioides insulae]